jgi:RNA-binding protein
VTATKLSSRDRQYLRSLAHPLEPVVRVGGAGLTAGVVEATNLALEEHELIKVRLEQGYEGDRRSGARELAEVTGADLVQLIGRVVVLYRPPSPRPSDEGVGPEPPKITLPGATKQAR